MSKQHNITDLSIAAIALLSIIFHFLFPNVAIAAGMNKKNTISFNYQNQIKPFSITLTDGKISAKTATAAKNDNKVNFAVSAMVVSDSQKNAPIAKTAKIAVDHTGHEEFTEYIAKDRFINAEKEAKLAAGIVKIVSTKKVLLTAYSSTPDQTDSSPFITASNTHVHDGILASNFLPFGTKVRIPSLFGNKVFTVEDRMKSNVKVDVWFSSRQEAMNFGAKVAEIEIIENL